MKFAADLFLWALAVATPLGLAAPFHFQARSRTPGKITVAIVAASCLTAVVAYAAVRLS